MTAVVVAIWRYVAFKWWLTGDTPEYFWGRTDVQVDNIVFGALAAVLFEFNRFKQFISAAVGLKWLIPVLSLILILVECFTHFGGTLSMVFLSINPALISILFLCLIVQKSGFIFSTLENKYLKKIGIISYSTYLWQEIFLNRSEYIPPKLALVQSFPLNIFLAFGCAVLSYKFVEIPMIRLGRRWSGLGRAAPAIAPDHRLPPANATESFAPEVT